MSVYLRSILILLIFNALASHCANPGGREGAVGWFVNGKLWLFGGYGLGENSTESGSLSDLWSYDISTNTWTFVTGPRTINMPATFGNPNTFSSTFHPAGLQHMCAWYSDNGLFFFGGVTSGGQSGNDVWKYDLTSNQWGLISGTSFNSNGQYTEPQFIGSRADMKCLLLNSQLYVFGGNGLNSNGVGYLNDAWRYDTNSFNWTWLSGQDTHDCSGTLSVQNTPTSSEYPPCMTYATAWFGLNSEILFAAGKQGATDAVTNEMYSYNPSTNEWTWLSAPTALSKREDVGSASASDGTGRLWLFGGYGYPFTVGGSIGYLADLLKWNGNTWLYLTGPTTEDAPGAYPTALGTGDENSYPGGREGSVMWRDDNGDLWLFGGYGYGYNTTEGLLNDLWKYNYTGQTWIWVSGSKQVNQRGDYFSVNTPFNTPAAPVSSPQSSNVPSKDDSPAAQNTPTNAPSDAAIVPVKPPVFPGETDQILLGVLIPVGVIGAGLIVLFVMLKKRKQKKKNALQASNDTKPAAEEAMLTYTTVNALHKNDTYASINGAGPDSTVISAPDSSVVSDPNNRFIPYSAITLEKEIGVGSYGKVYLGKLRTTKVAVKVANTNIPQEEFIREANFQLAIPPHPNIVQLLGISIDGPQPLVVLEYCNEGSLDKLLFESDKLNTPSEQIALAEAIARGLDHLHQNNIVHRDLAVRNVLLNRGEPKISDFGMSRKLKEASQVGKTATNIGPIRWMAPEALGKQLYSTKSDVWTFGILLYEIVARQEPHANDDILTIGGKIRDTGYAPEIPENCPELLQIIMKMCWKLDPEQRPEMSEICELLDEKK